MHVGSIQQYGTVPCLSLPDLHFHMVFHVYRYEEVMADLDSEFQGLGWKE